MYESDVLFDMNWDSTGYSDYIVNVDTFSKNYYNSQNLLTTLPITSQGAFIEGDFFLLLYSTISFWWFDDFFCIQQYHFDVKKRDFDKEKRFLELLKRHNTRLFINHRSSCFRRLNEHSRLLALCFLKYNIAFRTISRLVL